MAITEIALKARVDRTAFHKLIYNESRGNPNVGDNPNHYSKGIAQISKNVWVKYSKIPFSQAGDPNNYKENMMVGAQYLKAQYNTFHNYRDALAAYNMGPTALMMFKLGKRFMPSITQRYIAGVNN